MLLELLPQELPVGRVQLELLEKMSSDEFFRFCIENKELRIERTIEGDIVVMSPAGGYSSTGNAELTYQLKAWHRRIQNGQVYDSSGGFRLPDGSTLSPDASWVSSDRLATLSAEEKSKFPPIAPNFVAELRSETDSLNVLKTKMENWILNGVELAWLIDPQNETVWVYQSDSDPVELIECETVSGDPTLPDFTLELNYIWNQGY